MKGIQMAFRSFSVIIFTFIMFNFFNCAKQLTRDLQSYSSLSYLQDSKFCEQKTPTRIAIGNVKNEAKLKDSTKANLLYFVPIPLVFVNFGISGFTCKLGRSAFDIQLEDFVKNAFAKEAERSGCFELVNDGSEEYTVNLTIVENEAKGPYTKYFYMYFAMYVYGYGHGQKAGPGEVNIALKMDLVGKNGKNVSRRFESVRKTELLRGKNNAKELRRNYVIGMVESVSFAFKECIENIVLSINQYVTNGEIDTGREAPNEQNGDIEILKE
jgi:hypothetical protein